MPTQDPWDDFRKTSNMSAADQWQKIADDSKQRARDMQVDLVKRKAAIYDEARLKSEARIKRSAYADKAKGYPLQRYQRIAIGEGSRLDRVVSPVLDRKLISKGYKPNRAERAILATGGRSTGTPVARAAARAASKALGVAGAASELAFPDRAGQGSGSERTLAKRSPKLAREYADHQRRRRAAGR